MVSAVQAYVWQARCVFQTCILYSARLGHILPNPEDMAYGSLGKCSAFHRVAILLDFLLLLRDVDGFIYMRVCCVDWYKLSLEEVSNLLGCGRDHILDI